MTTIAEIESKLSQAQEAVGAFGAEYAEACLDQINGKAGAQNRVETIEAEHAKAAATVKQLSAALAFAKERDALKLRTNRAALAKSQLSAVKTHLAARDKAAEAMANAIAAVAREWQILVHRSEQAQRANPVGGTWPDGAATGEGELAHLVELEFARACSVEKASPLPNQRSIEGAGTIRPLVSQIKDASTHIVQTLQAR
jgi:hypothetical protein